MTWSGRLTWSAPWIDRDRRQRSARHDVIRAETDDIAHSADLWIPGSSPGVTPDSAAFVETDSDRLQIQPIGSTFATGANKYCVDLVSVVSVTRQPTPSQPSSRLSMSIPSSSWRTPGGAPAFGLRPPCIRRA